eukprot:SAG22_NODE_1257_length_4983_cov_2.902968_7_plen_95_part_01
MFTWGMGCHYALGLGTMDNVHVPTEVQTLRYARVRQAALAPRHAAAVGEDGTLYTWGRWVLPSAAAAAATFFVSLFGAVALRSDPQGDGLSACLS